MANNQIVNKDASYGVRTLEKTSDVDTQVIVIDKGGSGAESLVSDENPLPVAVTFPASQPVTVAGGATAALQTTGNSSLSAIDTKLVNQATSAKQDIANTSIGLTNDASASSDSGSFSLISLFKRLLAKIPAIGPQLSANSRSVTFATDISGLPVSQATAANLQATVTTGLTNYVFSALGVNSTNVQLAAGATFTGAIESILSQPAASVICKSDQAGLLTITQYQDASGAVIITQTPVKIAANQTYSEAFTLNGNYFSVSFKNNGANTTTAFILDVAYGTITPTTTLNNLPVAIREIKGQNLFRTSFARVLSGVDSQFFSVLQTGSGQTVNQSGGNLVLTAGTTINAETILRSTESFKGSLTVREKTILSQRIVNQTFLVELVDVIGDGLAATASSATVLAVTIPNCPFDSTNVGQSMYVGVIGGGLTGVPNRYPIASVVGNVVTFTVAGFSVASGTVSLFGWNYQHAVYSGTNAGNMSWDCQRSGWNSGDVSLTIASTGSIGHMAVMQQSDNTASLSDQIVTSTAAQQLTMRGSRVENIPTENVQLVLQIRIVNGTSAPASNTTWTLGMVCVESYTPLQVAITDTKPQSFNSPVPVQQVTPISLGTSVANIGVLAAGSAAIGDVGLQNRANATGAASLVSVMSPVTPAATTVKAAAGRLIGWQLNNSAATIRSVKMFNATAPTLGTTPAVFEIDIPLGGSISGDFPAGIGFSTAIVYSITAAKGLTDNTATGLAANDVSGSFFYA